MNVLGEDGTGETLRNSVVDGDGLIEGFEFNDIKNWGKEFLIQDGGILINGYNGGFNKETLSIL